MSGVWCRFSLVLCLLVWQVKAFPDAPVEVKENQNQTVKVLTTDFPPYSYQENGEVAGMAAEIVKAVLQLSGVSHQPVKVYPWARAFHSAMAEPDVLLFSLAKTPEREKEFHWIGPIAPYKIFLYRLKTRDDIQLTSLKDAARYKAGGEVNDVKQQYLQQHGFDVGDNLELVANDELNIRMLFAGRIDLLPFNYYSLPEMLKREGHNISEVVPALYLEEISHELYLAANKAVSPQIISRLKAAYLSLRESGEIARIQDAYIPQLEHLEFGQKSGL